MLKERKMKEPVYDLEDRLICFAVTIIDFVEMLPNSRAAKAAILEN